MWSYKTNSVPYNVWHAFLIYLLLMQVPLENGYSKRLSKAIQTLVYFYGFLTYPLYYAIQQPWIKREAFKATRAYPVHKAKGEITYKPIDKTCKEYVSPWFWGIVGDTTAVTVVQACRNLRPTVQLRLAFLVHIHY